MTDFVGIAMVVLVVRCGDGQHFGWHEHFIDVNSGRPGVQRGGEGEQKREKEGGSREGEERIEER